MTDPTVQPVPGFPDDPDSRPAATPPRLPPPLPPAPPVPRFCTACGAAWDAAWAECHPCAVRRYRRATAATTGGDAHAVADDARPITSAIGLYFAYLGVSVIGMISIMAGADVVNVEFVMSALASMVVVAWCVAAGRREIGRGLLRTGGWLPNVLAVAGSLATFAIASSTLFVLQKLLGVPQLRMTDDFVAKGYGLPTLIVVIAVQPAIFEELAFRGVILGGLRHALTPVEAIVVSAAVFMIIHLTVASFPHLFVMGVALGALRVWSGSLYPGMALHFCHNLICVLWERWSV